MKFSSYQRDADTHRITDGTESVYFQWPMGAQWPDVLGEYAAGYDTDEEAAVWCYTLDGALVHTGTVPA